MKPRPGVTGGLLASPADNGTHHRNRVSFIPEANLKVGYQVTTWLRGYVGYDALSLGHVARAGTLATINTLNSTVSVANSTTNAVSGQRRGAIAVYLET